ncbi:MAG: hypothetical protein J6X55_15525 [Victivallales bacterium]|nr:hypothetical protein [Victivallales bacterium]
MAFYAVEPVVQDVEETTEEEQDLPESTLALVEGEEKNLGEVNEASLLEFTVEAENKGKEEVFFKRAISSCSCIEIVESPAPRKLVPGERINIRAKLFGSRLGHTSGSWYRWIYLESKGYSEASLKVSGIFKPLISISPDASMYLGEFEGSDILWTRKFTIKATNPEKNAALTILPPKESPRFNLKLALKDEKARVYELEVTPKLPLQAGNFTEVVFLPVPLLGEDMGIRLRLIGKVLGRKYLLSSKSFRLSEEDFSNGIIPERTLIVTLKDWEETSNAPKSPFGNLKIRSRKHDHVDKLDKAHGGFHVSIEEKKARATRPVDYNEKILSDVELASENECISISRDMQGEALTFSLKISPEILKQPDKKVKLQLKLKGKPEGIIEVVVSNRNSTRQGNRPAINKIPSE